MKTKTIYYFVEDCDPSIDYKSGVTIALTPTACYDLSRLGIKYSTMSSFSLRDDFKIDPEVYFFDQLNLFERIDDYLKKNIEFCAQKNINLTRAHYNQIKYFLDTAIIHCNILALFVTTENPGKIIFISKYFGGEKASFYNLHRAKTSVVSRILPYICESLKVPLEIVDLFSKNTSGDTIDGIANCRNYIKQILAGAHVKSLINFIRFKKYYSIFANTRNRCGHKRHNILFLHVGDYRINYAVWKAMSAGCGVFILSRNYILKENAVSEDIALDLKIKNDSDQVVKKIRVDCSAVSKSILEQEYIFDWLNNKCTLDIKNFFKPYFENFISDICMTDLYKINKLINFFHAEKIDMIIARASQGADSAFVLSAATIAGAKKICIQHSGTVRDGLLYQMTELGFFDYYVSSEPISEEYFKSYAKKDIFKKCRVFQSPHYLRCVKKKYEMAIRRSKKETIMFVPADGSFGIYNFNNQFYNEIWYYEFLLALADYFATRTDKSFIFKYPKGSKWMPNSLGNYIRDKKYTNISGEIRPLIDCLGMADRIILDFPSTGLFEAAVTGLPVLCLYKKNIKMWDKAFDFFADSLQPFSTADDAIEAVKTFLRDDGVRYIRHIDLSKNELLDKFDCEKFD